MRPRLAVLASGRGSNLRAIHRAIASGALEAEIGLVIGDREQAKALAFARQADIPTDYIPYDKRDRRHFEQQAAKLIQAAGCDLVILAGFMRLLTKYFIDTFEGRILNIHPSLLPSFKGVDAQGQALAHGVKISGCTVHIVTEDMDAGPIVAQCAVPVLDGDSVDTLSARILEQEHRLFPEAIGAFWRSMQARG